MPVSGRIITTLVTNMLKGVDTGS